ncbi:PD-(D/E)XK nuclease family protein [Bacillus dakarensis]|uniref:PD-(D/E)XK nuclease family protein n=1 Tax=Robertmurraya dakarensis TaxID=1926278 RepID=UPI000981F6D4|nr:PD-(D/E)XK nuclease family protein [Bacillus dakarensis]
MPLIENLYSFIKNNQLKEKLLICNSYAEGHQWREWISREYGPVPNVTVKIMKEFVYDYGKLSLHKSKKRLMKEGESYWLIYSILNELLHEGKWDFQANLLSPGFVGAFHQAVIDLRHAGVDANKISPKQFEQYEKGKLMQELLQRYEEYLSQHALVDFPGLLPYLSSVEDRPATQRPLIIIHEHVRLSKIEHDMLSRLTGNQYEVLRGDLPFHHEESQFPAARTDFFHSTGVLSELKEVLRRMASIEAPLDGTEWISSDYEGYLPAAYALCNLHDIPISFSKGLPLQYSEVGSSVYAYLKWIESNFNIEYMLQAFRENVIRISKEDFSNGRLVTLLEKLGIGWGQERYALIEKAIQREEDEVDQKALQWSVAFFQQLFKIQPNQDRYSPLMIMSGLNNFLENYVSPKNEEDAILIKKIKELETGMGNHDQGLSGLDSSLEFVNHLLAGIRCCVSPVPEPGKIYYSGIDDGGYSGRFHTFMIGMDEENWTVKNRQDPILLDQERVRLSIDLQTSQTALKDQLHERQSRLGSIRYNCTMSFCSYSMLENKGKGPAFEVLQVYWKKSGQASADMEKLRNALGEPIYYAGAITSITSSETEAMLQSLISESKDVLDGKGIIFERYKPIAQGEQAVTARRSGDVTAYDGVLHTGLADDHYSSMSFSATQLELFASCSLQFYFKNILGIRPNDSRIFDRSRWLNSMERGSLMHEIFYLYMTERISSGKIKEPHDRDLLWEVTEKTILKYQELIPAPSTHITQKELAGIYRDVEIFIKQEEERQSVPKYLELQLHRDDGWFDVEVTDHLHIPLRGFVDRVDEIEPHVYRIYDYKTGSPAKFEKEKYFAKGKQLQHALYALAVEQWLRKDVDPEAVVKEAVYYFPTQKGLGKEVVRSQNQKDNLASLLDMMLDAIKKGTFLPTEDASICEYCDFQEVCGDHAKWRKNKVISDERFRSLTGVREYD